MLSNLPAVWAVIKTVVRHYWAPLSLVLIALLGIGIGYLIYRGM